MPFIWSDSHQQWKPDPEMKPKEEIMVMTEYKEKEEQRPRQTASSVQAEKPKRKRAVDPEIGYAYNPPEISWDAHQDKSELKRELINHLTQHKETVLAKIRKAKKVKGLPLRAK